MTKPSSGWGVHFWAARKATCVHCWRRSLIFMAFWHTSTVASAPVAAWFDARTDRAPRQMSEPTAPPGSQHGIADMPERVAAFGGSLIAAAVPGHGFRVSATTPLQDGP